jgi:ABC-2 type transport system ATP-binding protein
MIKVQDLCKEFKTYKKYEGFGGAIKSLFSSEYTVKKAVDSVSFTIEAGEAVGYIGVNGAGKSTTIKMMTGILMPSSGSCAVMGIDPFKQRKKNAAHIGVVFGQRSQLWWDLPVSESFSILRRIYDVPKSRFDENLAFYRKLLELDEFYLTPVRNLSLGQKMRADFAAALLHDPKVVYFDEPTIGLDIVVKDRIRDVMKSVNRERGTSIILTTHDLMDIEEVCKRIIVIDAGRIVFDGAQAELRKRFGQWRSVSFDVHQENTATALFTGVEGLEENEGDGTLTVKFHREMHQVASIINRVLTNRTVRDIRINEPELSDIVKEIYSGANQTRTN